MLSARVISNDGEKAELRISNGDRVHCYRAESESSKEDFLKDFAPGRPLPADLKIERLTEQVH